MYNNALMDVDVPRGTSEPLFLFDDDSDVEFVGADRGTQENDDHDPEPPRARTAFDVEAYQKESLARHRNELNKTRKSVNISDSTPTPTLPAKDAGAGNNNADNQGSAGDKKARQKPLRLDEGLLLSPKGFPQLIKSTNDFKIKGKGHEATDLNRLLQIYQFWTHQLYPRTQFRDTVLRVEKLCHSRRMASALSVWRDEAHGKNVDVQSSDDDQEPADRGDEAPMNEDAVLPSAKDVHASSSSRAPSHPPTSDAESECSHVDNIPDDDMDALIQEYSKERGDQDIQDDPSALDEYFTSVAPRPAPSDGWATISDAPMTDATLSIPAPVEDEDYWGDDMYI